MTINSRQKGKNGELELAKFLREHGFAEARRGQQFHGGADSPDCVGVPGHHIECKRVEALSLYAAYDQAVRDAGPGSVPLVAHRKNGTPHHPLPWLAILSLDDYLLMVRELEVLRGK
jgi:Holliday junction resolvase